MSIWLEREECVCSLCVQQQWISSRVVPCAFAWSIITPDMYRCVKWVCVREAEDKRGEAGWLRLRGERFGKKISPKQNYTCEFRQSRKTNLACSVLYEIARGLNMSCLIECNLVCVVSFNKKQETNRPLITSPATPQQHDLPLIISRYWTSANKKPFIHQQK